MGYASMTTSARRRGIAKEHIYGFSFVILMFAIGFAMTAPSLRVFIESMALLLVVIPTGICAAYAFVGFVTYFIQKKV